MPRRCENRLIFTHCDPDDYPSKDDPDLCRIDILLAPDKREWLVLLQRSMKTETWLSNNNVKTVKKLL